MQYRDWNEEPHDLPPDREPSWRPSVYSLVVDDGAVLLTTPLWHDLWELPGGGVALDETFVEAVQREVLEETGYRTSVRDHQPIYTGDERFYAPNVDEYFRTIPMVFVGTLESDEQDRAAIDFDEEIDAVRWVPLADLESVDVHWLVETALEAADLAADE